MAGLTIPYSEVMLGANTSIQQPNPRSMYLAQNAAWRRGDFVQKINTGTVTAPPQAGVGTGAGIAGPATSAITFGTAASTGAPATTYYIMVTYHGSSTNESEPSQEYAVSVGPNLVPTIVVASAGEPAFATLFSAYVGIFPGGESLQGTTTATGSTYTVVYTLANNGGANRSVTNPSTNILGLADNDSNALFFAGVGGAVQPAYLPAFGQTVNVPPFDPPETIQPAVITLGNGQLFEINLKSTTAYYPTLDGTTAGLALDSTTGYWYLDTAGSNAICTIQGKVVGALTQNVLAATPTAIGNNPGGVGDFGARVIAYISTSTALA
jgi:hypothetical protein